MQSHTGEAIMVRKGTAYTSSIRLKINKKIQQRQKLRSNWSNWTVAMDKVFPRGTRT